MSEATTNKWNMLNVASDLKGRAVLKSDTGEKLGEVEDLIIHPTNGHVLGISLRSMEGASIALAAGDCIIGPDAVMVAAGALRPTTDTGDALAGGVDSGTIVGATVVTEDGKLLGRVSEVHVSEKFQIAIYRVAESTLQRFFGGGFFLAGNLPLAYSLDGARLIVPSDTEDRHARPSLAEAVETSAGGVRSARSA
jgi:sporulation protein YlmC with PRC-barrel domain